MIHIRCGMAANECPKHNQVAPRIEVTTSRHSPLITSGK